MRHVRPAVKACYLRILLTAYCFTAFVRWRHARIEVDTLAFASRLVPIPILFADYARKLLEMVSLGASFLMPAS